VIVIRKKKGGVEPRVCCILCSWVLGSNCSSSQKLRRRRHMFFICKLHNERNW